MYDILDKTPDYQHLLGDPEARDPALDQSGDCGRLLRIHREQAAAIAAGIEGIRPIGPLLVRRIVDTRILRAAAAELRRRGPKAPGWGGIRLERLSDGETWDMCRNLSRLLRAGSYRRGPEQPVRIQKEHKPGHFRNLTIQGTPDRVVGKAAAMVLDAVVDHGFSPFSFGFRPRRDRHAALASAIALVRAEPHGFAVAADIEKAFDRIPFARVLDACRRHFPEDVIELIDLLASTGGAQGLSQGSPFSPLLFNIFADQFLDRSWHRRHTDCPLFRYADDLLTLCRSAEDASAAAADLWRLARSAGTPLKGQAHEATVDLAGGQELSWLGFRLRREGRRLAVRVGDKAWERLEMAFAKAHLLDDAPLRAVRIAEGWVDQMGPSYPFEDRAAVLRRVRDVAAAYAFEEVPAAGSLMVRWRAAHARWCQLLDRQAALLPDRLRRIRGVGY